MSSGIKQMIVGLLFFGAIGILGFYTIVVGEITLKEPMMLHVYFDRVAGLQEGNTVRISGLDVGKVKEMKLKGAGVEALLRIDKPVDIYRDYQITIRHYSPLGGRYVDILRGHKEEGLADYSKLRGETVPELFDEASGLVEENRKNFREIVENLRNVTRSLDEATGTLGKFIKDPSVFHKTNQILDEVRATATDLRVIVRDVRSGRGAMGRLLTDDTMLKDLNETVANLRVITEDLKKGKGPAGVLLRDEKAAGELKATMADLRKIVRDIEEARVGETMSGIRDVVAKVNRGEGVAGTLLNDKELARDLKQSVAHLREITRAVRSGEGTLGKLIMDPSLFKEANRLIVELRESTEDVREQAPINAFVGAVFAAF